MQVKRPTKINKHHLKSLQDTYSKNNGEEATQKQSASKTKKKDIKLLVIFSEIFHTHIPYHVTTNQLNFDKTHITGFRKTRDNRIKNLRTDSSNKSQ